MEKTSNKSKIQNAWAFYDWANSVHSLTITSAIFPIYFPIAAVVLGSNSPNLIPIFNRFMFPNTVVYSYTISFAFLILAFLVPIVSGIADFLGNKKSFMRFFCYLGSFSCIALYFFTKGSYWIGTFGFLFSIIGWGGSIVFYNSFLPEIATKDEYDRLSAKGFVFGYIGSVILLLQNLSMLLMPQIYNNISSEFASRISFLTVGVWWFLFAQISFYYLPEGQIAEKSRGNYIFGGFSELKKVFVEILNIDAIRYFLTAFFLFNLGAQTVMYLGALFGSQELHLPTDALIITILLIQIVAIPGAFICSFISKKLGNIVALMIIIFFWIIICCFAYFVFDQIQFYILAISIGFVMGGIQSNSRSTYAKLCPNSEKDITSYFSFYDVCDRLSTVLGTFIFGFIIQFTGNMRLGILILAIFFLGSLFFLMKLYYFYKINYLAE
jgi:UMF1 family MFS transporter